MQKGGKRGKRRWKKPESGLQLTDFFLSISFYKIHLVPICSRSSWFMFLCIIIPEKRFFPPSQSKTQSPWIKLIKFNLFA